jgi:hypothetical protein
MSIPAEKSETVVSIEDSSKRLDSAPSDSSKSVQFEDPAQLKAALQKPSQSFFFHGLYTNTLTSSSTLSVGVLASIRMFMLVYCFVILGLSIADDTSGKPFLYMANFAHIIIALYLTMVTIFSIIAWVRLGRLRSNATYRSADESDSDSDEPDNLTGPDRLCGCCWRHERNGVLKEKTQEDAQRAVVRAKERAPLMSGKGEAKFATYVPAESTGFSARFSEPQWRKSLGTDLNFFGKVTYILFEVGFSFAIVVAILYWTVEYPGNFADANEAEKIVSAHVHGVTFVWMLLDLFLNRITFIYTHVVFVAIFAVLYFIINGTYTAVSGSPIYSVLTWSDGYTALTIFVIFIGLAVAFVFGWVLTRMRNRCTQRHYVFLPEAGRSINTQHEADDEDEDEPYPAPAFAELQGSHSGQMLKRGSRYNTWKKRLFVIDSPYLFYYMHPEDAGPRGVISLKGCKVREEVAISKQENGWVFSLFSPRAWSVDFGEKYFGRTYYFCCQNRQDMDDWTAALSRAAY